MLKTKGEIENLEITLLLEAIYQVYGYDFRNYAMTTLKRRVKRRMGYLNLITITQLQDAILHDSRVFNDFMFDLSITITELFRDPGFYPRYNQHVIPHLKTFPFFNIWHAGCATGQEMYTMSIFLKENNMLEKATMYGTDFNDHSISITKKGLYPMTEFKKWQKNYINAGGKLSLSEYMDGHHESIQFKEYLSEGFAVSNHNLVTDSHFAQMELIICKNVLIYFNDELQNRVIGLFDNSLSAGGYLCLGRSESLDFTEYKNKFELVDKKAKIYRKL